MTNELRTVTDLTVLEARYLRRVKGCDDFFGVDYTRVGDILYIAFWWSSREMNTLIAVVPSLSEANYDAVKALIIDYAEQRKQRDCKGREADQIEGFYWLMGIACSASQTELSVLARYKADEETFDIQFQSLPEIAVKSAKKVSK